MPLADLVNVIETLQQRIAIHRQSLQQNEIRTRTALIDPLLTALGWDVSDPVLVTPEYTVGEGRADYALNGSESIPAAIVEAKRLGHALSDDERMQMLNYANARGVRYAAVTDGNVWELYEVFKQAPLEDRRLLNLRIINTLSHELALQLLLLWRPNLASGQPVVANDPILQGEASAGLRPSGGPDVDGPKDPMPQSEGASGSDWIALSAFSRDSYTTTPRSIRFPDGETRRVETWQDLVSQSAAWLWSAEHLTTNKVPVPTGGRPGVHVIKGVDSVSVANTFRRPQGVVGTPLVYDAHGSGDDHLRRTTILLKYCNVDLDTVHLRVGG